MYTLIALLSLSTASAASGYNAHGFMLVPGDGDLHDPLAMWRPEVQVQGSYGVTGLFEYARAPLVRYTWTADGLVEEPLLDNMFGLNVGGSYGLRRNLALTAAIPLYLSTQDVEGETRPAMGDLRLAVPIGLILPKDEASEEAANAAGFLLSVVPFLSLPSGNEERYLGSDGVSGGAVVAAGFGRESWQVYSNLGGEYTPKVEDLLNIEGGMFAKVNLGGSVRVIDHVALRLEGTLNKALARNEVPWTESPAELLLSGRYRADNGLSFTLGGAHAVTPGVGAARFRLFAGIGWANKPAVKDSCAVTFIAKDVETGQVVPGVEIKAQNRDKITDAEGKALFDACTAAPNVPVEVSAPPLYEQPKVPPQEFPNPPVEITVWLTPKVEAPLAPDDCNLKVIVRDAETGARIRDAEVYAQNRSLVTNLRGEAEFEHCTPNKRELITVTAHGYKKAETPPDPLPAGKTEKIVDLTPLPGHLTIIALEEKSNKPIPGVDVSLAGPAPQEPVVLNNKGQLTLDLKGGEWTLMGSTPNYVPVEPKVVARVEADGTATATIHFRRNDNPCLGVIILNSVNFESAKSDLDNNDKAILDDIASKLVACPDVSVVVAGHTDYEGSYDYNIGLSQRRMASVEAYLVQQGVADERMTPRGYGECSPIAPNWKANGKEDVQGMAKNRRVEFRPVAAKEPTPFEENNPECK